MKKKRRKSNPPLQQWRPRVSNGREQSRPTDRRGLNACTHFFHRHASYLPGMNRKRGGHTRIMYISIKRERNPSELKSLTFSIQPVAEQRAEKLLNFPEFQAERHFCQLVSMMRSTECFSGRSQARQRQWPRVCAMTFDPTCDVGPDAFSVLAPTP